MDTDLREDEYSYRECCEVRPAGEPVDLAAYSVQVTMPSRRRVETKRIYAAPLSDAAWARINAKFPKRRARS